MIKAVLFDMDGTLVDSEFKAMSIKKRILEEHGVIWSEELCQMLAGRKLQKVIDEVLADSTEEQRKSIIQIAAAILITGVITIGGYSSLYAMQDQVSDINLQISSVMLGTTGTEPKNPKNFPLISI